MGLEKFIGTQELDLHELASAVFLELAAGAEPQALADNLVVKIDVPREDAEVIVGNQNARLQETMHHIADRLEMRDRPKDLESQLVEDGWPNELAASFVSKIARDLQGLAKDPDGNARLLAKSRRRMLFGILWFAGGSLVTWFTQYSAEHGGGNSYALLAWGPILYGLVLFFHAAVQWSRYKLIRVDTRESS
jgi:hypothetical protein